MPPALVRLAAGVYGIRLLVVETLSLTLPESGGGISPQEIGIVGKVWDRHAIEKFGEVLAQPTHELPGFLTNASIARSVLC